MPRLRSNPRVAAAAAVAAAGAIALAGCSSSGSGTTSTTSSPTGSASGSASASPKPSNSFPVEFSATLTSSGSRIAELGTDHPVTYGITTLDGRTTINGSSVAIKMQATVDYKDSSGKLGGFLELKWSDGTILALRQDGTATYDSGTKETSYDAKLEVVGASTKASGTSGTGTLTGTRAGKTGTTGGTVKINVTLDLVNAPSSITGDERSRGSQAPSQTYSATIAP